MSIWGWLKRVFGRSSVHRDISGFGADDLDLVNEEIDLTGKPLKSHHRRRGWRDVRLLPKRRPTYGKRKKVMSRAEAVRLFSDSLRTRNRRIRDLKADPEQLKRLGLPLWRSEEALAEALSISIGRLYHYASFRKNDRVEHYVRFAIKKRDGGDRIIMAPKTRLKKIQRTLHRELVSKLELSSAAHGFRPGHSIRTGAEPHVGKAVVLKVDLADFFGTVTFARVRGLLIAVGYSYPVATTLALLMTESERQPVIIDGETYYTPVSERYCVQGAPTSPGLCNTIALRLDRRLTGLAKHFGFTYTRYADDLSFSGDDVEAVHAVLRLATAVIKDEGFSVNKKKTRVMRQSAGQRVTGVTVNDQLGLSRKERRRLRAMIHQHGQDPDKRAEIRGKLAYLSMLNPEQAARLEALIPE